MKLTYEQLYKKTVNGEFANMSDYEFNEVVADMLMKEYGKTRSKFGIDRWTAKYVIMEESGATNEENFVEKVVKSKAYADANIKRILRGCTPILK